MIVLIVLLTVVTFIVIDPFVRMGMKRAEQARLRRERLEALDVGLRIAIAEETKSLKRVEVPNPKARILAVDDEAIVLDSFRKILVLEGYAVDVMKYGALDYVEKPFDEDIDRYRKLVREKAGPEGAAEGAAMTDVLWEAFARLFLQERST